ncbi:MAG: SDR family oxidoreductase [Pseudobacteriovorax sp.]|nr:SDR family oxidoreductase [Pseudobacteriovorax sp.]
MKNILISGCNRGLGLGLVKKLLRQGHHVWGGCRRPQSSRELWEIESDYHDSFKILEFDVTNEKQIKQALELLPLDLTLDCVINNAGINEEYGHSLQALSQSSLEKSYLVNAIGPILLTRQCLPFLERSQEPKIFHISSRLGSIAENSSGHAYSYRMSKSALNMLVKNMSLEFSTWTVMGIHPGWVQTDMGGAQAPTPVEDSVEGVYDLMIHGTSEQSGKLYDFQGQVIPW